MHLKRIAMPKSWPIAKKRKKFIVKSRGPYASAVSFPLAVLLRDILKVVRTRNEAKKVLQGGNVLVDNRTIKDEKFTVGLFDRIYIKKLEKAFTLALTKKGKLEVHAISPKEAYKKTCKVIGKKILKGNKVQINLYDGKNFIATEKVNRNDSVIVDLKTNKITGSLKLVKNAHVLVIAGRHKGESGKVSEVNDYAIINTKDKTFKIPKENVFVIEENE